MNEPIVSVVIPTYNRANILARAVDSVRDDSFTDIEIIICDDCSTDETVQVARELALSDERIKIVQLARNQGAAAARNGAMLSAKGKYIAFLDSDDEWVSGKLARQVKALEEASPEIGLCLTGAKIIKNRKRVGYDIPSVEWEKDPLVALVNGSLSFTTSTILFKRECIEQSGLMELSLRRGQDEEFIMRIFMHYGLVTIPEVFVVMHLTTYGKRSFNHMVTKLNFMMNAHYDLLVACRGQDVADKFQAKLYLNIITAGLSENQYLASCRYIKKYFQVNPALKMTDVKSLMKALLHGVYHCKSY